MSRSHVDVEEVLQPEVFDGANRAKRTPAIVIARAPATRCLA